MKGSSASMGTDRLTRLCTNYDKLSDAELRLQAPALLRTLTEELDDGARSARAVRGRKKIFRLLSGAAS